MDLNSASYFVQVIQSGSFVQAARLIGIPKSTLSDKISALEAELGVTLLTRTTRKLSATEAGEAFYKKAQPALLELRDAAEEAAHSQSAPRGRVRVTAPADFASSPLADAFARFRKKFPAVSLELDFSDREVDLVGEGYDAAIRAGRLADSSLISRKLGISSFGLVASVSYLKRQGYPRHPGDLERHSCLRFTPIDDDGTWELQNPNGRKFRLNVRGEAAANSVVALKRLAELDQGIALLPPFICLKEIERGILARVLPEWTTVPSPINLVYPRQKYVSTRLRALIPFMEEAVREVLAEASG